ncbi:helix-turn-helix domain-containing protein [Streptomyces sp. NPDC003996]
MQFRYVFRLDPTPGQCIALARTLGRARVVYNDAVAAQAQAAGEALPSASALSLRGTTAVYEQVRSAPVEPQVVSDASYGPEMGITSAWSISAHNDDFISTLAPRLLPLIAAERDEPFARQRWDRWRREPLPDFHYAEQSGSSGALLHRSPLRTGRASHPRIRLKLACGCR